MPEGNKPNLGRQVMCSAIANLYAELDEAYDQIAARDARIAELEAQLAKKKAGAKADR